MDTQSPSLQQVLAILKEQGQTEDQVAEFLSQLTKTGFANMYEDVMQTFTDTDMQAIEACDTQEKADALIRDLYRTRIGKDPDEQMQLFLDTFAKGFLDSYEKERKKTPQSP